MNAAGYVLTGMRRIRSRAHAPMILAHSLTSDFFGLENWRRIFPTSNPSMFGPQSRAFCGIFATSTGWPDSQASPTSATGATPPAAKSSFAPATKPSGRGFGKIPQGHKATCLHVHTFLIARDGESA
jgi:hypothetical protein